MGNLKGFGAVSSCSDENIGSGRSYYNTAVTIDNCFFTRSAVYTGNGGVIYRNFGSDTVSITNTVFYNCVVDGYSGSGGAIYQDMDGKFYMKFVCAKNCRSQYLINFAYLSGYNDDCKIEYLSMSGCSTSDEGQGSITVDSGKQVFEHSNSSLNNGMRSSSIIFQNPTSHTCSYCSFAHNHVSNERNIEFNGNTGTFSFVNVVGCNSPSWGVIVVTNSATVKFQYSICHQNQNTLFFKESGTLTVENCIISHSGTVYTGGYVNNYMNNTGVFIRTYQIVLFGTVYCPTDIFTPGESPVSTPFITPQKSPIETPKITPHKTLDPTHKESPIPTIMETLAETKKETPIPTLEFTPHPTFIETPMFTIKETYAETFKNTVEKTLDSTMNPTKMETPIITLANTPIITPVETPEITPAPTNNQTGSTVITVVGTSVAVIGLSGVAYAIKVFKCKTQLEGTE